MSLPLLRRVQRIERGRASGRALEIMLTDREEPDGAGGLILHCNGAEVERILAADVRRYRRETVLLGRGWWDTEPRST